MSVGPRMACAAVLLAMAVSGCVVGGKSFSMDSVSRTPFFGLSLQPKAPDTSESIHRSIRRDSSTVVSAETADLRTNSAASRTGWWPGTARAAKDQPLPMQAIPLPRTDVARLTSATAETASEPPGGSSNSPF